MTEFGKHPTKHTERQRALKKALRTSQVKRLKAKNRNASWKR